MPLITGIGHESDFTIADFCADLRAPTPTAAAELVAPPREVWVGALSALADRLRSGVQRQLDRRQQRLDQLATRLGRPSGLLARQQQHLAQQAQRMHHAVLLRLQHLAHTQQALAVDFSQIVQRHLAQRRQRLDLAGLRLQLLNPHLLLQRGYALLTDAKGAAITSVQQAPVGGVLRVALADGELDATVLARRGTHPLCRE